METTQQEQTLATAAAPRRVVVGMKFPADFQDGRPIWRVVKARGGKSWDCVIDADDDYGGVKKVFGSEEILSAAAMHEMWSDMADEHAVWWKTQEVGATVHYNNGFGSYVRGVIVIEDDEKKMRPTALVGKWAKHDLPRLDAAGNLHEGYHVRSIRDGETMQPNYSNMVEAVGMRERDVANGFIDPRGQPAIDLTPPQLTVEQTEAARLAAIIETVQVLLNVEQHQQHPTRPYSETLRAALISARAVLNAALV